MLTAALRGDEAGLEAGLAEEERLERSAARAYWLPLRRELERMRHASTADLPPGRSPEPEAPGSRRVGSRSGWRVRAWLSAGRSHFPPVPNSGKVILVGAGPGDPGLLTVRAAEALAAADVVVHDALVNPAVLARAREDAEKIYAGKRAGDHAIPQENLNELLVERARAGRLVVRLKGGDPFVFGRGGEEAEALAAAGIPFEIVPGVTSAIAAPAFAGIPLTHRDWASTVQFITGHEDPAKATPAVDWAHLGHTTGTQVILMGAERLGAIAAALTAGGRPGTTPVAVIQNGTLGSQRTVTGTLENIAGKVTAAGMGAPAVIVVGEVVALRERLAWYEQGSLFGQRIVVTRTRAQAGTLAAELRRRAADVYELPTIRIEATTERQALVEAITGIGEYDWLVFTSPNGVSWFFDYFCKAFPDIRALGNIRIAAVGPATAEMVRALHLQVDVVPKRAVAADIAQAIQEHETVENLRFLLLRAEAATLELPRLLEELGGIVDDVAAYRTVAETADPTLAVARFEREGADWVTFASSSAVERFHARFPLPGLVRRFPQLRAASIGPETSRTLRSLGWEPAVEAKDHTIAGLVAALEKAAAAGRKR